MTVGAHICITDVLAREVGRLAAEHRGSAVDIHYDDERPHEEWVVTFESFPEEGGVVERTFVVNDQTGVSRRVPSQTNPNPKQEA